MRLSSQRVSRSAGQPVSRSAVQPADLAKQPFERADAAPALVHRAEGSQQRPQAADRDAK